MHKHKENLFTNFNKRGLCGTCKHKGSISYCVQQGMISKFDPVNSRVVVNECEGWSIKVKEDEHARG